MNTATQTVILALMIMSTTLLSGCITDVENEDEIIERMTRLEAILTDPEFSENNPEMVAKAIAEMEAITGEKYELKSETNVTPTPDVSRYRVGYSLMEHGSSPLDGIGWFKIVISGIFEIDQTTISGFTEPSIDKIDSIEVFINNESVDKFVPIVGERRKVTTTIVGDWDIRLDITLKDGTVITCNSNNTGWGLRDMSDHPDYTGPSGLDERYIETSDKQMSREEAKALCEELGIVWGCDDTPTTTPTLTSTKVTPKVIPTFPKTTPTAVATPEPTLNSYYRIEATVDRTQWNENTLAFLVIDGLSGNERSRHDTLDHLDYVELYVDGKLIVAFEPTIVKGNTRMEIKECPMIINLPDGMINSCEITMMGSFSGMELSTSDDGDYIIPVYARTPPMRYEEEYNQFPVWNP